MKTLNYSIEIKASKEHVWKTMLDAETYNQWANAFSAESQYEGEWKQGTTIKFIDPNLGGTKALLEEIIPFEKICAKHIAIINKDGGEDLDSEIAKKWIGATETYHFVENEDQTLLKIEVETPPDFENMFNEGWAKALPLLKELCEKK